MPILTAIGVAAGVAASALGVGGHLDAQEKNEQAEQIREMAKSCYDAKKSILDLHIKVTQQNLVTLGTTKQKILESSMERFIRSYEKIKEIQMSANGEVDDLASFQFSSEDMMEIQKLDRNYESAISNDAADAADAAAGAALLLAAGGSIPALAEGASMAGVMLSIGEVGTAASIAGSAAVSALTPLAAVAAPVVLFTGLAASMKADENLEQAQVMKAQADEAIEKMDTSMILCEAISEKSEMFNDLINQLNGMFDECSLKLEQTISRREAERKKYKNKKLQGKDFTREELKLMAVTGSLAKAMKTAVDTPMLKDDGSGGLTPEAESGFENMQAQLPAFEKQVAVVEAAEPAGGYGSQEVSFEGEEKDPFYMIKNVFGAFNSNAKKTTKEPKRSALNAEERAKQVNGILQKARNVVLWCLCACSILTIVASFKYLSFWMILNYAIWAVIFCPKVAPQRPIWKRFLMVLGVAIFFVIPWGKLFASIFHFIVGLPIISSLWNWCLSLLNKIWLFCVGILHKIPIVSGVLQKFGI